MDLPNFVAKKKIVTNTHLCSSTSHWTDILRILYSKAGDHFYGWGLWA